MNEPQKFQSKTQPDIHFWAEFDDFTKCWIVTVQRTGFPATEAHDDWFSNQKDAEAIAQQLAEL